MVIKEIQIFRLIFFMIVIFLTGCGEGGSSSGSNYNYYQVDFIATSSGWSDYETVTLNGVFTYYPETGMLVEYGSETLCDYSKKCLTKGYINEFPSSGPSDLYWTKDYYMDFLNYVATYFSPTWTTNYSIPFNWKSSKSKPGSVSGKESSYSIKY